MNATLLRAGDHIRVGRCMYCHHGIYVGEDRVVHWDKDHGSARITCTGVSAFADGSAVTLVARPTPGTEADVVVRALSRVGETGYSVVFNNCEHFASWCVTGDATSRQVREAATSAVAALALSLVTGGVGILAGAGLARRLGRRN